MDSGGSRPSMATETSEARKCNPSTAAALTTVLLLSIATWNVQGLSVHEGDLKIELLIEQLANANIDICALQETKVTAAEERSIKNSKLILFDSQSRHYGLGFVISPRISRYVVSHERLSDRVAVLDVRMPTRNGQFKMFRFVNAYGPTSQLARTSPIQLNFFYRQLSRAIRVPSRYEIFLLGDFNSKLGTLSMSEVDEGVISQHVGRYGTGKRNSNGEHLLNFLVSNDLFAANTAFQHPCRHRTTRVGYIAKPGRSRFSKETVPTFVQIDFIICRRRSKCLFTNARSYEHPRTVLKSDHKLVSAQIFIIIF